MIRKLYPQASRGLPFSKQRDCKFSELIELKFTGQSEDGFRVICGCYCFVVSRFCFLLPFKLFRVSTMSIQSKIKWHWKAFQIQCKYRVAGRRSLPHISASLGRLSEKLSNFPRCNNMNGIKQSCYSVMLGKVSRGFQD